MNPYEVPCYICRGECIPMADYTVPVCASCDLAAEDVLRRALTPPEALIPLLPPRLMPIREGTPASFRGPASQHVIDGLVAALFPTDTRGAA